MTDRRLIIFDLDGTLIDSAPDLAHAVNAALIDINLTPFAKHDIQNFVGNGAKVLVERALAARGVSDDALTTTALSAFYDNYRRAPCVDTVLYDGVKAGLDVLSTQYVMAIATNKPYEFVPPILKTLGIDGYFDVVLGGDSLPVKKPDPAPLLHICQVLDVPIERALMVGDSKNDVLAGQQAGMTTCVLTYGYNYDTPIQDSQPDYCFDNFSDLVDFLLARTQSHQPR